MKNEIEFVPQAKSAFLVCALCCLVAGCGKNASSSETPRSNAGSGELDAPVLEKQLAAYGATAEEYGGTVDVHLNLAYTSITDEQLATLPLTPNTTSIDLSGTKVTDAGLEHLKKCTRLKRLMLVDLQITDEGVKHLREFDELEHVDLKHTRVSSKEQLALMKYLRQKSFRSSEK